MSGKVAVITGGTSGIGLVSAREMARKGCHVIITGRSEEAGRKAVEEIKQATSTSAQVDFMRLDLSSLRSVKEFADAYKSRQLPIHILLNNAGVMACPRELTEDGLEMQFGTNHIGHFLLTNLLLDTIERSAPSRIVNVSSYAHTMSYKEGVRFDDLAAEKEYSPWARYGQSKLCNVLFTYALARRMEGKQVYVNCLHPGYVATNLQRHMPSQGRFIAAVGWVGYKFIALTPDQGALSNLYLSTSPDVETNNMRAVYMNPKAKLGTSIPITHDRDLQEKLWDVSTKICSKFM
eukprot:GILI01008427.1.p2 GENE.GILI01008427.1~~GILI01008427.1.p2  ORF type:complete len:328 (+),score=108.52 GILI01008427.1:110-985(+)